MAIFSSTYVQIAAPEGGPEGIVEVERLLCTNCKPRRRIGLSGFAWNQFKVVLFEPSVEKQIPCCSVFFWWTCF
jgi:hypothetical protein